MTPQERNHYRRMFNVNARNGEEIPERVEKMHEAILTNLRLLGQGEVSLQMMALIAYEGSKRVGRPRKNNDDG